MQLWKLANLRVEYNSRKKLCSRRNVPEGVVPKCHQHWSTVLGKAKRPLSVVTELQLAGDDVALSKTWQVGLHLSSVVEAARVGTVQPHVCGGPVRRVPWVLDRHPNTGSFVASKLFEDQKLPHITARRGQPFGG